MSKLFLLITIILLGVSFTLSDKITYPQTKKVNVNDTYFGVVVPDPYRWLENDTSKDVAEWVAKQNEITFKYLSQIPFRDKIKERLTKVWDYPKMGAPFTEGGKWFYYKNNGLQNQYVLYCRDSINGPDKVLLDPNTLSKDGTVALNNIDISFDGKYLAYSIARSGSDWNEIFVKNTKDGSDLPDHLYWVKFSNIAFYKNGFFYSRYDEPKKGTELKQANTYHKIYYHEIGTDQSKDLLIYKNDEEPLRTYNAALTDDEKYIFIYEAAASQGNSLLFRKTNDFNAPFIKIADGFDYEFNIIGNIDENIFVKTNCNAPNYKLIKINLENYSKENWVDIIPEKDLVLETPTLASNNIIAGYMKDAHSKLEIFSLDGKYEKDIDLPTFCSVNTFNGKINSKTAFYSITSYTSPGSIFKYNFETGKSEEFYIPEIDFDGSKYITKLEFVKSKDGTKVPIYIVHKKDLKLDGKNPTMLYGYGGFNKSQTPSFKITRLPWLESGGIWVTACLRGGGEYGENWHLAGTKLNKQNVFDDFIAAAEYLIEKKYTSPSMLAIQGGSNGGLLVGAVMNQRPELFKVALPAVGVMDMLRFHKFTIGWSWVGDYGSSDDSTEFEYIYKYSPLHNIRTDVNYPATLVTTADHDDRVVPAHSFKYIATLQEKYKGNNPVLIRIDVKAGHGAGKPTTKQIETASDQIAFAFYNMNFVPKY